SHEKGGRIRGEDAEEHRHHRPEPVLGNVAHEQEEREPSADPHDAQQRRAEGGGRRRPRVRQPEEDEREEERRKQASEEPGNAAELHAEQGEGESDVTGENERAELTCEEVELVQGDEPAGESQAEEPPVAEVDDADAERQKDRDDEKPGDERRHRAPNRRCRLAYSSSARRKSSARKSGHSTSVNTSSEYADCQRRKFETRCSPDVRIIRSGSGSSGA